MNLRDGVKFRREKRKRPADVILAFEEPKIVNQVYLYDGWRFRIAEELTRKEFMQRHQKNRERQDYCGGNTTIERSKFDMSSTDENDPDPDYKYFYVAEIIP